MTLQELQQIKDSLSQGVMIHRKRWLEVLEHAVNVHRTALQLLPYAYMADAENGVCCCGDNMDRHSNPMDCGHSPVDSGSYAQSLVIEDAKKILNVKDIDLSMVGQ